ncbi:nitroreductase [Actinoplanes sp. NPDC049596]|uniref:nitroreductase n=1 Tax=unclassified Actinoplanes TaxID=2626549 RepID=UPI0034445DCB
MADHGRRFRPAERPARPMTPAPAGAARPVSHRIANEALYRAVVAAGRAPSAFNAQPWRWRVTHGALDLFADHDETPVTAGAIDRLTTISCGAALHHARLALAARGWRVTVTRQPDTADPTHLARLRIDGPAPVSPDTVELARAIDQRRTDTRAVTGAPIEPEDLHGIVAAFEAQHVSLGVLRPDQILGLTVASSGLPDSDSAGAQWRAELALWAGADRIVGAVDDPRLPIAHGEHDRAATFAMLHGPRDDSLDWLHAGEALSAGSLVAAELGVSVLPFSAPIGNDQARDIVRRALPEFGHLYLMIRLGHHDTGALAPRTGRNEARHPRGTRP